VLAHDHRQHREVTVVGIEDGHDEVVLRLEVVVDVPERDVGALRDLGEGRAMHALFVEERPCALDETLSLAAPSH